MRRRLSISFCLSPPGANGMSPRCFLDAIDASTLEFGRTATFGKDIRYYDKDIQDIAGSTQGEICADFQPHYFDGDICLDKWRPQF